METKLTRAARAASALTLVGLPILVLRWTQDPFDVPKLALLMLIVGPVAMVAVKEGWKVPGGLWVPVVATLLPLLLSWIVNPHKGWTLMGEYGRYQGLVPGLVLGAWTLLLGSAFRERTRVIVVALVLGASGVALYGLIQMVGLDPFDWSYSEYTASTVGHSNFAGAVMAIALPSSLALWITTSRWRAWGRAAFVLIALAIVGTFSQGAWVAAVAGCALTAAVLMRDLLSWALRAAVVLVAVLSLLNVGSVVSSQIDPHGPLGGTSVWTRGLSWSTALAMASSSPVTGAGPNAFAYRSSMYRSPVEALVAGRADDPHSVPLALFADQGFIGILGLIVTGTWIALRVRRLPPEPIGAAFAGGAVAYLVVSLVTVNELALRGSFWACIAGLAAVDVPNRLARRKRTATSSAVVRVTVLGFTAAATIVSVVLVAGFLRADVAFARALVALRASDLDAARDMFQSMTSAPSSHYHQSQIFGEEAGRAALRTGARSSDFWEVSAEAFASIEGFPYVRYTGSSAYWMTQRSAFDMDYVVPALRRWRATQRLDPNDPGVAVEIATLLVRLGHPRQALEQLLPFTTLLRAELPPGATRMPDLWGTLAIAHAAAGDPDSATDALEFGAAVGPNACRVLLAREYLRQGSDGRDKDRYSSGASRLRIHLACDPGSLSLLGPL